MNEQRFIIQGGKPLKGEIEVRGSKNAALPLLAASVLFADPVTLSNLPLIEDVFRMVEILESMGARATWLEKRTLQVDARAIEPEKIDQARVTSLRASLLFIGPLLARFKHCTIAHPGGDAIGARPLDTHFEAFKDLGITIASHKTKQGMRYEFDASHLHGGEVILEEFSVTATENVLMLVSLLPEKTTVKLAATEPHVGELINFLRKAGVSIANEGDHALTIQGASTLKPLTHEVIPDYLEEGTFLILSALMGGAVSVKNLSLAHLDAFRKKLTGMGITIEDNAARLRQKTLLPIKLQTLPHPGFPTDLQAPFGLLLTRATGVSSIHEPLYEKRFGYLEELKKMGADISIKNPHEATVTGPTPLTGASIRGFDLRAGMTLILAGLIAKGETVIENIYQVDRGYEAIDERLRALGADIRRVSA